MLTRHICGIDSLVRTYYWLQFKCKKEYPRRLCTKSFKYHGGDSGGEYLGVGWFGGRSDSITFQK